MREEELDRMVRTAVETVPDRARPMQWQSACAPGTWVVYYDGPAHYALVVGDGEKTREATVWSSDHPQGRTLYIPVNRISDVLSNSEADQRRLSGWPDTPPRLYVSLPAGPAGGGRPYGLLLVRLTEEMCRAMFEAEHQQLLPRYGARMVDLRVSAPAVPPKMVEKWREYICEVSPVAWREAAKVSGAHTMYVVVQKHVGPRWEGPEWCTANIPWNALAFMMYRLRRKDT